MRCCARGAAQRPSAKSETDPDATRGDGCRVKRYDFRLISCLMPDRQDYSHAGFINDDAFCLHPNRERILEPALARQDN